MGHSIAGFVARKDVLRQGTAHLRHALVASLEQGFGFLPVTDGLYDEVRGYGQAFHESARLTPGLARLAARMSRIGPVAYVETDYFGGTGDQAAVCWSKGSMTGDPWRTRLGAINTCLSTVGVEEDGERDRFESVGLHRHRHNADWADQAREEAGLPMPEDEDDDDLPDGEMDDGAEASEDESPEAVWRPSGHRIEGFIAERGVLREGTAHLRSAYVAALEQGLGLLPVTDELRAEVGDDGASAYEEFRRLSPALARLGAEMSRRGFVIYAETDYEDGGGTESAMLWDDGEVFSTPWRDRMRAISSELLLLGVEAGDHYDEFEAAGLARHRYTHEWAEQARAEASGDPSSST